MINISRLYCGIITDSDHLRYSGSDLFGPVVVFNCTNRCNLKCQHCYSWSGRESPEGQLTTDQVKKLFTDLANIKCPVVLFSGGEPLIRDDLTELLAEASRLKLRTVISTNGVLIDSAVAEKLIKARVSYVGISIDGQESFHDKFRGTEGSFRAAMRGLSNCKKVGLKTGLRFTITRQNANQVPFVFEVAASVGARRICFYHLIRTGRAKNLEDQVLTSEQTRRVVDTIVEKTQEFVARNYLDEVLTVGNHSDGPYVLLRMESNKNGHYQQANELLFANGGNKIGEKIACVSWDGNVYPDQFWRNYSLGNIKDKSFSRIWNGSDDPVLAKIRDKSGFADTRCLCCKWFDLCKGNYRFLGPDSSDEYWLNEPACYLTDDEIGCKL